MGPLGLIDFDTSHVVEFTKRLHRVGVPEEQWVDGARIVAGWPGESAIMPEQMGRTPSNCARWAWRSSTGPRRCSGAWMGS